MKTRSDLLQAEAKNNLDAAIIWLVNDKTHRRKRQTENADALNVLVVQLMAAHDEHAAREIVEQFSTS